MKGCIQRGVRLLIILVLVAQFVYAQVHVRGYTRKDGTYVQPHYRSSPDGNPTNNWSYPGNVNPYTGKVATGNPDTYLDNYHNRNSGATNNYPTTTTGTTSDPVADPAIQKLLNDLQKSPQTVQDINHLSFSNSIMPELKLYEAPEFRFAKTGIWLRKGPGAQYPVLYKADEFEILEVVEKRANGWLKVSYDHLNTNTFKLSKRTGFISSKSTRPAY